MRRAAILLALGLTLPAATGAQQSCSEDAVIVFDGSGSMAEMGFNRIGEPRITEARQALHAVLPEVAPLRRIGLVVYGPGAAESCANAALRLPPMPDAAAAILSEVDALDPTGETPLTASVVLAAEALDYRRRAGTVVLVTDGDETCGGAPCAIAAAMKAEAPGLTVHVIGFKVRGRHFSWDNPDYTEAVPTAACMADLTGGLYVRAESADALIGALRMTLGCAVLGGMPAAPLRLAGTLR